MLTNITPRQRHKIVEYEIQFMYDRNSGYGFPCDENGKLLPMTDCAKANYDYCMTHRDEFTEWNEITAIVRHITENATGTCICGEKVELWDQYMGACECPKCGRWYNLFGQELIKPEYWEDGEDW